MVIDKPSHDLSVAQSSDNKGQGVNIMNWDLDK